MSNNLNNSSNTPISDSTKLNDKQPNIGTSQEELDNRIEVETRRNMSRKQMDKPLKVFGGICMALFTATMIFTSNTSVNTSDAAKNALSTKVSTSLSAGTLLLEKDKDIGKQDYTITHQNTEKDTKIWIWDYAAEDGDYVQVLVNGTSIGDSFMIKHKPVEIKVPTVGKVQIKGIRDGGGGITYAVRYDLTGTNYFNSAPEGEFNTYTLIKE